MKAIISVLGLIVIVFYGVHQLDCWSPVEYEIVYDSDLVFTEPKSEPVVCEFEAIRMLVKPTYNPPLPPRTTSVLTETHFLHREGEGENTVDTLIVREILFTPQGEDVLDYYRKTITYTWEDGEWIPKTIRELNLNHRFEVPPLPLRISPRKPRRVPPRIENVAMV